MTCNIILSLDLSTTCTGWAILDIKSGKLLTYGTIKPKVKNISKLKYPIQQLLKMRSISSQIIDIIEQNNNISYIVIEEINRHKSRLSGKVLDGLHFILLDRFSESDLSKVRYIDSDGLSGWRTLLKLRLTEADKLNNKESRAINSKLKKGSRKIPIIGQKHLAARYVNRVYGLNLNVDSNRFDADVADAIGLGSAALQVRL